MADELVPLITPDEDDPKAMRFNALMYGIELAYDHRTYFLRNNAEHIDPYHRQYAALRRRQNRTGFRQK